MAATPVAGLTSVVTTGGSAVNAVPANVNGGLITNPATPGDQGISPTPAEPLYINAVGPAALIANGTTFALRPGESWTIIPGQTTPTSVNALTSGHRFSVIYW
jgi:hypothetical protein